MAKKEQQLMFKIKNNEAKIVAENKKEKINLKQKKRKNNKKIVKNGAKNWFKLDNAAIIYPGSSSEKWSFVFRVSCVLKNEVQKDKLQLALDDSLKRFPSFNVCLKKGFFWNYFETNSRRVFVEEEKTFPCFFMDLGDTSKPLIRVLYSKFRVSVEVFHAVTDGHGAMVFLVSLIMAYLEKCGVKIDAETSTFYLNTKDKPSNEETEDSFAEYASAEKGISHKESPAYNIKGQVLEEGTLNTTIGVMSVQNLKEVAKKYNATLSSFLAGVLGYVIVQKRKNSKKPVKISVPIDLRYFFESKTLRNFSSYKNIELNDEDLSLEETITKVSSELKQIDKSFLQKNINSNVNLQKNVFIKLLPLFIKKPFLSLSFNLLGEKLQTFAFSNLGKIDVPEVFYNYAERLELNLGRSKHNSISVGVVSLGDTLCLTISSKLYESTTERDFFRQLSGLGVAVKIESNRRDEYGG
ncbi:MAG: hypothetical protein IJT25_01565 [Clostridia bacterium]|nr:hypothetical protein [Clostridia bacterium]